MNLADVAPRRYLKISVAIEVSTPEGEIAAPQSGGQGAEAKTPSGEETER